jgi:hypothetical protein
MTGQKKFSKLSKISIRNKKPDQPLLGGNCEIFLDGVLMEGVTFLKLELKANGIAKISMDMIANVELEETEIETEVTVNTSWPL